MNENKNNLVNFIRTVHPMPADTAISIAEYFNEKTYNRNDLLLKEGRVCNEYYFLCNGFIRAWTTDLEGQNVTTLPAMWCANYFPSLNVYRQERTYRH